MISEEYLQMIFGASAQAQHRALIMPLRCTMELPLESMEMSGMRRLPDGGRMHFDVDNSENAGHNMDRTDSR